MNKLLLAMLLVFTSLILKAQINKSQWLLGGELNFIYRKDALQKTIYTISPSVGYFVKDKLALGARAAFTNEVHDYLYYGKYHSNSIGPFFRYYFLPKTQKINVFADAAYIYWWSGNIKTNGYNIKTGPAFFISPSVALEFTVGYLHTKYTKSTATTNEIRTGVGFQVHLGRAKQTTNGKNGD
jgi:hypothetical protein